ncbi:L-threonylcarbamoyladenylate synthase [Novosphingobium sp.]|uniref:L-threonylcarbamoyladenylate synthase n=1 Tax=Novosphingobium sp. TaxID=1874826 RepID=UPI00286B8296|nr:L-threonylcarbamoyladenylate synthase [Novosphingobium sp.]
MSGKRSGPEVQVADAAGIAAAAMLLREGKPVAVPTETVYGLAARADSDSAVATIYAAKGRPSFNPLIVHVRDRNQGETIAGFDSRAKALAAAFWPGALTMVLPLRPDARIAAAVTAGLPTIALRCPAHPVIRAVLIATGLPLAAPSANRSGGVSPTTAAHVAKSLAGRIELVLDGGACETGLESTIVALRDDGGWQVLRLGPITAEQIALVLNAAPDVMSAAKIEAPGQLERHYSPGKPVRLGAETGAHDEFMIGFGAVDGAINLSPAGDLNEAATRLYDCLHQAAAAAQPRIAVAPVPERGIGAAINDRLRRAAA